MRSKLKSVPPQPQGAVAPKARPLSSLTREELGREWVYACRVAMGSRKRSRRGGTLDWLRDPAVRAVLEEITERYWEREWERDRWAAVSPIF